MDDYIQRKRTGAIRVLRYVYARRTCSWSSEGTGEVGEALVRWEEQVQASKQASIYTDPHYKSNSRHGGDSRSESAA